MRRGDDPPLDPSRSPAGAPRRSPPARLRRGTGRPDAGGRLRDPGELAPHLACRRARLGCARPPRPRRPLMLVVDPTVVLCACAADGDGFAVFDDPDLVAPPLLWSEARSVLHEMARRGELTAGEARRMRRAVDHAPI